MNELRPALVEFLTRQYLDGNRPAAYGIADRALAVVSGGIPRRAYPRAYLFSVAANLALGNCGRIGRMDQQQLAELECHLAAGTDLGTALAAVAGADDRPPARAKRTPCALAKAAKADTHFLAAGGIVDGDEGAVKATWPRSADARREDKVPAPNSG